MYGSFVDELVSKSLARPLGEPMLPGGTIEHCGLRQVCSPQSWQFVTSCSSCCGLEHVWILDNVSDQSGRDDAVKRDKRPSFYYENSFGGLVNSSCFLLNVIYVSTRVFFWV